MNADEARQIVHEPINASAKVVVKARAAMGAPDR